MSVLSISANAKNLSFCQFCPFCRYWFIIFSGQFCSNCGIGCCIQATCFKKANATHLCKAISDQDPEDTKTEKKKFKHHWIPGNLPLHSECEVCEEVCGDGPGKYYLSNLSILVILSIS